MNRRTFAAGLATLGAGVAAMGAGIAGVAQDGTPTASPMASPAASPIASPMASPAASPQATAAGVTIIGYDIGWEYEGQRTAPGAPVDVPVTAGATINLPNTGAAPHNFVVDQPPILVDMPVGQTVTATLPADIAPGTYKFYCNIPGHEPAGMVGNLIVQ
jgi:plastocyanin